MLDDPVALTRAHKVWSKWIADGTVRPSDYDRDFAEAIAGIVGAPSGTTLLRHLQSSGHSALELVMAALQAVRPFGEMLADLLAMYAQIGARGNENESLRIKIGDDDDGLDESLHSFRETVESVRYVIDSIGAPFDEVEWLWSCPLRASWPEETPESIRDWLDHYNGRDLGSYGMPIPRVPASGLAAVDKLAIDVIDVLEAHRRYLLSYASSLHDLRNTWVPADKDAHSRRDKGMTSGAFFAATDHWLSTHALAVHAWVAGLRSNSGDGGAINETVEDVTKWLRSMPLQQRLLSQVLRQLTDILSLPAWRKRHEIYSAWIVTLINKAVPKERLQFIVRDGVFAMPFRAVHLADILCSTGVVEFWSELKSPLSDPVGHGRKNGIQPDYRFVQSTRQTFQSSSSGKTDPTQGTMLAIEVKQYLKSAKKNPGQALADYTRGLPKARVFLVAYGPVSQNVMEYVPDATRSRAEVFRDVRPFEEGQSRLKDAISEMFPPPQLSDSSSTGMPFMTVSLTWSPSVHDLDLYVYHGTTDEGSTINYQSPRSFFGYLTQDAFDGGPETVELLNANEETRIVVHSHEGVPLMDACPTLQITGPNGIGVLQLPSGFPADGTTWHAATIGVGDPAEVRKGTGSIGTP